MATISGITALAIAPLRLRRGLLALAGWLLVAGGATAEPVNRHVLAIYDSTFEAAPDATLIHSRAEMPLNHLGYILDYRDAATALPDPDKASDYAAVITWFTYDVSRPSEYLAWARRFSGRGIPFITFGQLGVPTTPRFLPSINRLLEPMGIAYTGNFVASTNGTTIVARDAEAIGFERPLETILPGYPVIRRLDADAAVLLEVRAPQRERQVRSALVTAGPNGAFIPTGFALYVDPTLGRTQWIVNPFVIFRRVLGAGSMPVPDTTTISGRRLYYSMVDGDGWSDDIRATHQGTPPAIASEVLASQLIRPYPDLPATVGLIASDLDPAFGDGERAAAAARAIFALPQVEVASHTATSPLQWSFFEDYSRAREEELLGATVAHGPAAWLGTVAASLGIIQTPSGVEHNRMLYVSGSRALPRAYLRDPFSLATEVEGAAETMAALAPQGKRAAIYSWTGDAKPFEAAIRATRTAGLRNINGGGAFFDPDFPSISDVSPIARLVGTERQIYAVGAPDKSDIENPNGGSAGFPRSKATLAATESPVRLKGAGLHYYAFAAKRTATLKAVRDYLDWARAAPVTPITASQYAAIADGFFTTRLERTGEASWAVSDRDGLQTIRFDDAADRSLDIRNSVGAIGSTTFQGSLYVTLDPAVPEALVTLRAVDEQKESGPGLALTQLAQANWLLRGVVREACRLSFSAQGFGASRFSWKDVAQGSYAVAATGGEDIVWHATATVDENGLLAFELPDLGPRALDFAIRCLDPSSEEPS